jgi:hypothetical protein
MLGESIRVVSDQGTCGGCRSATNTVRRGYKRHPGGKEIERLRFDAGAIERWDDAYICQTKRGQ